MKRVKKIAATLMAVSIAVGATACSTDKSWAAKTDSLTVPIGAYIYYLNAAYQGAEATVTDTSKPVLEQQIEGKAAEAWIKDKALEYTKTLFLLDDKMKELKLTLTADETKNITSATDSAWQSEGPTLEKYGISKSSFSLAYSDYSAKYQKIFTALYGKGGTKAVSDADLKTYFEKNYTDFSMVVRELYKTDANGSYAAMTDAESAAAKKEFDDYATDVKTGKKTMQQAADAYKASSKQTTDVLGKETIALDTDTSYPDEFKTALKAMKNGEVKTLTISSMYYVLVMKNDITKKTTEQLGTDATRNAVLAQMKGEEYTTDMKKAAQAYSKMTLNQAAIDSYKPSMFVTPTSSAAATPSAAASASSAAAVSSAAASSK